MTSGALPQRLWLPCPGDAVSSASMSSLRSIATTRRRSVRSRRYTTPREPAQSEGGNAHVGAVRT